MLRLLTIGETSTVLDDTIAFITSCSRSGECEDAEVTRDSDESHNVPSIAATLLINGTTGHSRFRLPFRVYHDTTSSITAESAEAEVLRRAPLIVWDEAGTQKKDELEVVDRLLRDIAVSHDPPVSSLFVTNRRAGFNIAGTILAKKECYGTSLSAMMPGSIRIVLLARGDTYTVTLPYAHCEGMMIGTLSMEYGGQIKIESSRTKYVCTIDFQVKPVLGGEMNVVSGTIKLGNETLTNINATWDEESIITSQTN